MIIRYMRNFCIGVSTHIVESYNTYTKEDGLIGNFVERIESPRIADCVKLIGINKTQLKKLKALAREKHDGIILENGEHRSW